jgi:hypothetical protein
MKFGRLYEKIRNINDMKSIQYGTIIHDDSNTIDFIL